MYLYMTTKRNKTKKNKTKRNMRGGKKNKSGKQWTTAISAASKTLKETGSITKARQSLRKQALSNARKLFGSIGETL
jgi:hypothetical protein